MTFEIKMTREEIIDGLANYGSEFTAADVRGFCRMNDIAYQTVTKIKDYVGRGKWNLEVTTKAVQNIENSFSAPAVEPQVQQNLVPETDIIKFSIQHLEKLYKAVILSTLSLVFRMVKHSV